jgi:TPR repeat protein
MADALRVCGVLRKILIIILLVFLLNVPSFASLQKGESFMVKGQFQEAIKTLMPLADKDNPPALYLLGCIYLNPQFTNLNYKKGIAFLELAVHLNYAPAIDELAGVYLSGDGVEKNEAKALHYYEQASFLGYGPSQFNCGIMYKEGMGCNINVEKAYFFLCLASLNTRDLNDLTLDAARYRDEVAPLLAPHQRQAVLSHVNALTLPHKVS